MSIVHHLVDFLTAITIIALIVGLIRPTIVVHWGKERTRMRVAIYYGLGLLLLCFLGGIDVVQYFSFYFIYLLMLITLIAFIVGLIRPTIVVRWGKEQTRKRVVIYYGLGLLLLSFINVAIMPEALREKERQEQLQKAQLILEKAKQQLSAARRAYDSGNFKNAIASAQEATSTLKSIRNIPEASTQIPEVSSLNDEAKTLLANAEEAREQEKEEQKEKERQEQLQQAQPILEKAKQQLSAARRAYDSGNFKNAIASTQEATSTLKSIRNIPEASTLNDEAKTLLADAKEAFANAPKFILSADQLYQEYENNEIAADNKYKGKIVLISGTIQNISKGDWGRPIIEIGSELYSGVRCHLKMSEEHAVARLSKGQRVSVKGEVKGKDLPYYVHVKNCTLQ